MNDTEEPTVLKTRIVYIQVHDELHMHIYMYSVHV